MGLALDKVSLVLCTLILLYLYGRGVCTFVVSFLGCINNMFVDRFAHLPVPILKVVCQYVSGDYGCSFADFC